jgi:hypothetical protein
MWTAQSYNPKVDLLSAIGAIATFLGILWRAMPERAMPSQRTDNDPPEPMPPPRDAWRDEIARTATKRLANEQAAPPPQHPDPWQNYKAAIRAIEKRIARAATREEFAQCEIEAFNLWTSDLPADLTPDANRLRIDIALRRAEIIGGPPMIRPGDPLMAALDARYEGHAAWGDSVEGFAFPVYDDGTHSSTTPSLQYRFPFDRRDKKSPEPKRGA